MPSYAIVEAPSVLGLKPDGVEYLGEKLLELGLAERLNARRAGKLDVPAYDPVRDTATGTLNAQALASWTPRLADAVEALIERDECPVILGGDCSILLGPMLALKRRGRYGLLFIDGHADFYQPEANPNGQAASMELAFAAGYGPKLLTDIEGRGPLVLPEDVVVFGFRDAEEQAEYGSQPLPPEMRAYDLTTVRTQGVELAAREAVRHLCRKELDGFFVHIDADCLDDSVMPAVDYRIPGGLSWQQLERVLTTALASQRVSGIEITIYNPSLDPKGTAGRRLVQLLGDVLGSA